jgi:hypothetical protein
MVFCAVIHILFPPVCILFVASGACVHGKYVFVPCRCDGLQLALAVGTSDVEIVIGVDGGGVLGKQSVHAGYVILKAEGRELECTLLAVSGCVDGALICSSEPATNQCVILKSVFH